MGRLFGTNGVRGVFGRDFTLELIHDLTLAAARYFQRGPILVGRDGRHSSDAVSRMVRSALNYAGLDAADAGLVPTPCLEYCVKSLGYAGGMMVTASHNPPEYNGIKPVAADGVEIPRKAESTIEEYYFGSVRRPAGAAASTTKKPAKRFGVCTTETRAISAYVDGILSHVDVGAIRRRACTVAVDMGNGTQAVAAPLLCRRLGCAMVPINDTIDGDFPGRGSEPTPSNLQGLSDAVRRSKADIGIAFDGDGDRSIICDETGSILTGDVSALFLARHIIRNRPGSTIVTCLNSGGAIESLAGMYDSAVIRTRVGSVEVSRRMTESGALLGFEENGGFMFGPHNQVRDGLMTLALSLSAIASCGGTLSEIASSLPPSHTARDKIQCTPEQAARLLKEMRRLHPDSDTTDGIKICLGASRWVMLRPSGTEPMVRVYAEAPTAGELRQLISEYVLAASKIIKT